MLNWIDAGTDRELFLRMYHQYLKDLSAYSKTASEFMDSPSVDAQIVNNYLLDPHVSTYFVKNKNDLIGFIAVQHVGIQYGVEKPIWYIVEFFIAPEFRRCGYGGKMFRSFLERHEGDFFYYVIKKNLPAKSFWAKMTQTLNLKEVKRPDIDDSDPELEIHVFEREG